MSESTSDADKIRNKRLAKLQSQATAPPKAADAAASGATAETIASSTSPSELETSVREPNQPYDVPASSSNTTPDTGPDMLSVNGEKTKKIRISSAGSSSAAPQNDHGPSLAEAMPSKTASLRSTSILPSSRDSIGVWQDRMLSSVFRVTIDPRTHQDSSGNALQMLPGLQTEMEEQGVDSLLNTEVLDQALLEAASNRRSGTPLDYLLGCWKRVVKQSRGMKGASPDESRYEIVKEARRLCMSYCIFAITIPDMFGWERPPSNPLTPHLLLGPEDERGACFDFLTEVAARFSDDDSIREALVGAMQEISQRLGTMTMNDDFRPYIYALKHVARFPPIVQALVQSPAFLPKDVPTHDLETSTFLGPFFQLSPLQEKVTTTFFSAGQAMDQASIVNAQKSLRMTLQIHQTDLLDIANHFIRSSKESRDKVLDWFALTVNLNHKRRAMQVDNAAVSSDGFMINVTVDRIDVDYLRRHPRVDIKEETKMNADQSTSDEFYAEAAGGSSNFISEIFFLTLAAHHYGMDAAINKLDQVEKDLKYMAKQMQRLEAEREKFINTPQYPVFENAMKRFRDRVDKAHSYKFALQGVLFDDLSQARSMQFMRYVIVWLLRLVAPPSNYPKKQLQLPLPTEQPSVFKCLPEYFLEDVVNNFKFIFRHLSHVITSTQSDELVTICITFLRSSEYIRNPHFKAGLVAILFYGIWPTYSRQKGVLGDLLNGLRFANEHLLHALLKFYIEVETTGAHTQFYDKFNVRYEIFQIIKCIWSNTIYRERLAQESKINVNFFVRFVNLLLNDVTFVLDESLSAFVKINDVTRELQSPNLEQTMRSEKEELLAELESRAKNFMQLTNETMSMLKLFTKALADSFTMREIVQRLADMLDYNLDAMVGPKSSNLNVPKKKEYGFEPIVLLSEIVDVFINLMDKPTFIEAVARDGRSYKPENFEKATGILKKYSPKAPEELAKWTKVGERVKKAKELDAQAEEDLGEIPDEFLDPLLFTLMEDPVILPTSKTTVDMSTIRSHLLSDPNDPFNRAPLTIEDVVPNTDLKSQIEAFKAEKKGKRNIGAEAMDLSSG
ncbi:MAG: hypothetical protein M1833_002869 [Piccolia ochrophora]|nr:MAG: hypothetical protein M1833_002869 [Piccolia ochrophora]